MADVSHDAQGNYFLSDDGKTWRPAPMSQDAQGNKFYDDGSGWKPVTNAAAPGGRAQQPAAAARSSPSPAAAPSHDYAAPAIAMGRDMNTAAAGGFEDMSQGGRRLFGMDPATPDGIGSRLQGAAQLPYGMFEALMAPTAPLFKATQEANQHGIGDPITQATGSKYLGDVASNVFTGVEGMALGPPMRGAPMRSLPHEARGPMGGSRMPEPPGPRGMNPPGTMDLHASEYSEAPAAQPYEPPNFFNPMPARGVNDEPASIVPEPPRTGPPIETPVPLSSDMGAPANSNMPSIAPIKSQGGKITPGTLSATPPANPPSPPGGPGSVPPIGPSLESFAASGKGNAWLSEDGLDVYVRNAQRNIAGEKLRTLDIPNVGAQTPGQGTFTRFLQRAEALSGFDAIYVENVETPKFAEGLKRLGFTQDLRPGDAYPSFYKLTGSRAELTKGMKSREALMTESQGIEDKINANPKRADLQALLARYRAISAQLMALPRPAAFGDGIIPPIVPPTPPPTGAAPPGGPTGPGVPPPAARPPNPSAPAILRDLKSQLQAETGATRFSGERPARELRQAETVSGGSPPPTVPAPVQGATGAEIRYVNELYGDSGLPQNQWRWPHLEQKLLVERLTRELPEGFKAVPNESTYKYEHGVNGDPPYLTERFVDIVDRKGKKVFSVSNQSNLSLPGSWYQTLIRTGKMPDIFKEAHDAAVAAGGLPSKITEHYESLANAAGADLPSANDQGAPRASTGYTLHKAASPDDLLRFDVKGPDGTTVARVTGELRRPPGLMEVMRNAAKTVEKIISPTTVDASSRAAEASIRQEIGMGRRDTEIARAALDQFNTTVREMDGAQRRDLIRYMEGRSLGVGLGGYADNLPPQAQPLADALRAAFKQREAKLKALPSTAQMSFVEDYYPHMWKDPRAAQAFTASWPVSGKQGKGGFVKGREIPTVEDGLAAGLIPQTLNPLEAAMHYIANADRFIAINQVFDDARAAGTVKYRMPGKQLPGEVELHGRLGTKQTPSGIPMRAYAPDGWARVFNNFVDPGFTGPFGDVMSAAMKASNFVTALELSLSGYHTVTMANEAMISTLARGIGELRTGHPIKAAKAVAEVPIAPALRMARGHAVQQVYQGKRQGTPLQRQIADLIARAGGQAVKMDKAWLSSRQGNYVTAFKRGALQEELLNDVRDIKARPITGTASVATRHIARTMDTAMSWLFEVAVPKLKVGAFEEQMGAWLARNPTAPPEVTLQMARTLWDSIDNRFGEMVRDNIFWKNSLKQASQLSLRSYSWTFGAAREIAGGVWDAGKAPFTGKWTPRMDYVIALPIIYGLWSAVYQMLKTGQPPQDVNDLMAPRTGGTDQATGQPERVVPPGFMKDVFGWTNKGIVGELWNKTATLPRTAVELMTNRDWRGLPIAPGSHVEDPNAPYWLKAYFDHVMENLGPFGIKNALKGQPRGSNLSTAETLLGFQPAGRKFTAPDDYKQMMKGIETKEWRRKLRADERQERRYKGPVD